MQFRGAIATTETNSRSVLPPALSPATYVYIPVDLCNATNGRLFIQPNGTVTVQARGPFSSMRPPFGGRITGGEKGTSSR